MGFSLQCLLLLQTLGCSGFSSWGSWALELRLSNRGSWAYLPHSTWSLPGAGLEPVFPAWAGGPPTTGPPGKSDLEISLLFAQVPDFDWRAHGKCSWNACTLMHFHFSPDNARAKPVSEATFFLL